jgi:hypothetical protein
MYIHVVVFVYPFRGVDNPTRRQHREHAGRVAPPSPCVLPVTCRDCTQIYLQ